MPICLADDCGAGGGRGFRAGEGREGDAKLKVGAKTRTPVGPVQPLLAHKLGNPYLQLLNGHVFKVLRERLNAKRHMEVATRHLGARIQR